MRSGRARCSRPSNSLTRPSDAVEQLGDTWHCKIQRSSASEDAGSSRVLAHVGAEESHACFAAATAALRGGKATQRCARSSCSTDPGRYILNTRFKYIKRQTKPLSELLFVSSVYQRLDMRNASCFIPEGVCQERTNSTSKQLSFQTRKISLHGTSLTTHKRNSQNKIENRVALSARWRRAMRAMTMLDCMLHVVE